MILFISWWVSIIYKYVKVVFYVNIFYCFFLDVDRSVGAYVGRGNNSSVDSGLNDKF